MKIELRYDEYQPFILDTLKWGKISENIYYARFQLKDDKYVHYTTYTEHTNNKSYFVFNCTPIIYHENFKYLKDINLDDYLKHEDYWQASIAFEYPEEIISFDSWAVHSLKWEYEIWFINIDHNKFFLEYDNMPPVEITVGKKD